MKIVPSQLVLRDGGGIHSTADWAQPHDVDHGYELRLKWWSRIRDWGLVGRLRGHVQTNSREPLLNEGEVASLRGDLSSFLTKQGCSSQTGIADGQPIALDLLKGLLELWADIDIALCEQLVVGVRTGVLEPIPASGVWRKVDVPTPPSLALLLHDAPWRSGLEEPALLEKLVAEDVQEGFAEWIEGDEAAVRQKFGKACAAGKLGIVHKPGSAPRLIGDSTISNVNKLCRIQEKIELPNLLSVASFVSQHPSQSWVPFSLDFHKAHKRVKVHPTEQGLSVFAVKTASGLTRWVHYKTAHFGCSWASYWWARLAAAFVRTAHRLLFHAHFLCIYVDDLLALLPKRTAGEMACLLVCLAAALGFPLSWHKLALGNCLQWVGWLLDFEERPRAALPLDKLKLFSAALHDISNAPQRVCRKQLQSLVGRLVWYTAGAHWLRPWLQVFFHALNKPRLHFLKLDALQLQEIHAALNEHMRLQHAGLLSDVQAGWGLLELGGHCVRSPKEVLVAPRKNGYAWAKFGEVESPTIRLSKDEVAVVRFFSKVLDHHQPFPLVEELGPTTSAAADAFAEGNQWGIGGWFLPPDSRLHPANIHYFSIVLGADDLPLWFFPADKDREVQLFIAALEALAQLVLLECQAEYFNLQSTTSWISLRQQCDNAGVVAVSQKGLTMKQPLASVLQAMAVCAAQRGIMLRISHVAGTRNDWADWLSRGTGAAEFWKTLDPRKRINPDWKRLINLGHG